MLDRLRRYLKAVQMILNGARCYEEMICRSLTENSALKADSRRV
jgi:hypothetical protein